jgi:periplasmic protein TonB
VAAFCAATSAVAEPIGEIREPIWTAQPSAHQASAAYPFRAMANEKIGVAVVRCVVGGDGRLNNCSLACETPKKWGFGAAALKLTRLYRMKETLPDGRSVAGATVALPFNFNPPFLERLPRCDAAGN